jgi:hypothetical protein
MSALEPNEVFRLAMALGLAPLVYGLARQLRFPGARWPFGIMYGSFAMGYAMTVFEDLTAPGLFNLLQHACATVGAIAFLVAARAVFIEMTRSTEGGS